MLCPKPITLTLRAQPVPCGQCIACRVNRQRLWVGRMVLENAWNPGMFATLTYAKSPLVLDEDGTVQETLDPTDLRVFLKSYRRKWTGLRFFGVGEYGDKSQRPHYHVIIWDRNHPEYAEDRVKSCWPHGFVTVSPVEPARIRYIAQYCMKKMTRPDDSRLGMRYPEFARMSKRPPLGYLGMECIKQTLYSRGGAALLAEKGDVPTEFRYEGTRYPIGRYWREWLREEIGIKAPPQTADAWTKPEDWAVQLETARLQAQKLERRRKRKVAI